jgi:hypothetical protein
MDIEVEVEFNEIHGVVICGKDNTLQKAVAHEAVQGLCGICTFDLLTMKRLLFIPAVIVVLGALNACRDSQKEGVSGESTVVGDRFVLAEFGYAQGGRILLYAVFRSFPTNLTYEQRAHDPRYSETDSGVLVRDNDGRMIPVGRVGMVYLFDGDNLRKMRVRASEDEVGIGRSRNMDEIWGSLQRFEVRESSK